MFKKKKGGFWTIVFAALFLCVGVAIGVDAIVSLCNTGEGYIRLFFGIAFLLFGGKEASKLF